MKLNVVPLVLASLTFLSPGFVAAATGVVTIQPDGFDGKDTFYSTSAFFDEGSPNTEYMSVGGWADEYFAYIEFDLSQLPEDAVVTNASMELFQDTVGKNYNEITALRITSAWEEDLVSKASNPPAVDAGVGWIPAPSVIGWWTVDVTDLVTNWANGTYPNYGIKLDGRYTTNNHIRLFHTSDYIADPSLRPKLVIEYTVPDEPEPEPTPEELVASLQEVVNTEVPAKSTKNSYFAHIDKLLQFFNGEQVKAALNQIGALLKKVSFDVSKGDITPETATEIEVISGELEEHVLGEIPRDVPLITQVSSPFPPESAVWSLETYANGAGGLPTDPNPCGLTIGECGCALSSLAMIGNYYDLGTDINGQEINPSNMNAWLEDNDGYDSFGNMWWSKALAYLGEESGTGYASNLYYYSSDVDDLDDFVEDSGPAIAFNKSNGHYFVVADKLEDGSYSVKDPYWYLTGTTNDEKDVVNHVQDYDNVIDKVQLFKYSSRPKKIANALEIHLASPAELLLTDSQGRRTGFDPDTNTVVNEIPGSFYDQEAAIYTTTGVDSNPHMTKKLMVQNASDDVFELKVIGTGTGDYTLSTLTVGQDGVFETDVTESTTTEGEVDSYIIDIEVGNGELQEVLAALYTAAANLSEEDRIKVETMLDVIVDKVEKSNMVAAESKTANLLAYIAHKDITDGATLVTLLEELLQSLE